MTAPSQHQSIERRHSPVFTPSGKVWNSGENSENGQRVLVKCAVVDGDEIGEWFDVKTGVKQGCNMSGFLFLIIMDSVMRRTEGNGENGIRWRCTCKLDDLDFADDIALICRGGGGTPI